MGTGAPHRIAVEFESIEITDIGISLTGLADHVMAALRDAAWIESAEVGASSDTRQLFVRVELDDNAADSALDRVHMEVTRAALRLGLTAVPLERATAGPARHRYEEDTLHTSWPPQFTAPRPTVTPENLAFTTARLFAAAHALAHELEARGDRDLAQSIERWLRPGLSTRQALVGMRHELITLRGTHLAVFDHLESRLDHLIVNIGAALRAAR